MKNNRQRGFTLIGLLIVLAIIGTIATIVIRNVDAFWEVSQNKTSTNITIDRIDRVVVGEIVSIDRYGEYSYIYFEGGTHLIVTNLSVEVIKQDAFNCVMVYELQVCGQAFFSPDSFKIGHLEVEYAIVNTYPFK